MEAFTLLPDPQTNGGLLFAVNENDVDEVKSLLAQNNLEDFITPIGRMTSKTEKTVVVK
jgi:selenide,water dikinase